MIYACEACRFLFEKYDEEGRCPDCGKMSVRLANEDEIKEYNNRYTEKKNNNYDNMK